MMWSSINTSGVILTPQFLLCSHVPLHFAKMLNYVARAGRICVKHMHCLTLWRLDIYFFTLMYVSDG